MSDNLMELNVRSLITYILKRIQLTLVTSRMKILCYKKAYFKKFSIVRTSEGFSIRDILHWKTHSIFRNVEGLFN